MLLSYGQGRTLSPERVTANRPRFPFGRHLNEEISLAFFVSEHVVRRVNFLSTFRPSKQRLCDCSEEGKPTVTRLFACRAGRIRTADLLTPRDGQRVSKVLVRASIYQSRRPDLSTELPPFS